VYGDRKIVDVTFITEEESLVENFCFMIVICVEYE